MSTNRRFSLALKALTELDTESASPARPAVGAAPSLTNVLAELGPLPREALFLGVASDNLPVLLNLYDPHPGPLLIAGDAGAGKTDFLRTIAQAVMLTQTSDNVQYGVITNYPDEWQAVPAESQRVGIFPVGRKGLLEFLQSLAAWAHSNKNTHQCVLLLVDDLESLASLDLEAVRHFRWLLLRGPSRRVWPIVTLNAARYGQIISWLPSFRTRIFGRVADPRVAEALGGDRAAALHQLEARVSFSLRERDNWLRFWLPSC